jgi:hypothetical protein
MLFDKQDINQHIRSVAHGVSVALNLVFLVVFLGGRGSMGSLTYVESQRYISFNVVS